MTTLPGSAFALTFDDGPDPVWTPKLLDVLRHEGVRATFFPIAPRAQAHPDLIARILSEGQTVGLHCEQHIRHSERDAAWLRHDTRTALGRLAALGVEPAFWRTPYGDVAPWSASVAREHGLRLVGWTADTNDWRGELASDMFDATRELLVAGAIVLAHDGLGPGALRKGIGETLAYVRRVIDYARERRLRLEPLS
jgi:peptidoglycan/xylan/chitin deacetylase (PgdA/CDA1 family)